MGAKCDRNSGKGDKKNSNNVSDVKPGALVELILSDFKEIKHEEKVENNHPDYRCATEEIDLPNMGLGVVGVLIRLSDVCLAGGFGDFAFFAHVAGLCWKISMGRGRRRDFLCFFCGVVGVTASEARKKAAEL